MTQNQNKIRNALKCITIPTVDCGSKVKKYEELINNSTAAASLYTTRNRKNNLSKISNNFVQQKQSQLQSPIYIGTKRRNSFSKTEATNLDKLNPKSAIMEDNDHHTKALLDAVLEEESLDIDSVDNESDNTDQLKNAHQRSRKFSTSPNNKTAQKSKLLDSGNETLKKSSSVLLPSVTIKQEKQGINPRLQLQLQLQRRRQFLAEIEEAVKEEKLSDDEQQQDGADDDNFVDGVTIEGEGKYQIIEVFDDVSSSVIAPPPPPQPKPFTLLEETEIVLQTEASPLPRPPAVVKKKFPAPALLTKAEERAVALQQMETLKMQQPRRRKQNLAQAVGVQKRDDTIQTEIFVIDSENTVRKKRNTMALSSSSDTGANRQAGTVTGGRGFNHSSNDTDEFKLGRNHPTVSSSNSVGKRPKRIIKRKIIWDTDESKSTLEYNKLLRYEALTVSTNTMENVIRKNENSDDKASTSNKNKKKRQIQQQHQKQNRDSVDTEESAQGDTNSNTSENLGSNLRRRSQTTNMAKLNSRQNTVVKKTQHLLADYVLDEDEENDSLSIGVANRSSRKNVNLTTSGAGKNLRKRVKSNVEGSDNTEQSNIAEVTPSNSNLRNSSKGRKGGKRSTGNANEKQLAIDDAMIIRRRSESSESSSGDNEIGPQTRNSVRRKNSINGNNVNIDIETNEDDNTASTTDTNSNAYANNTVTKDWSRAKQNIKKSGAFSLNCPRYPETLLQCIERRIKRPNSTTISELSYNSEVVVYRSGNVAQVMFNVGDKPVMKNSFNDDLLGSLVDILGKMAIDNDLSAVVVCSEGEHFCAGLDVGAFLNMDREDREDYAKNLAKNARLYLQILITFCKPIIVAVKGQTVDFGVTQLPLYDVVVSSDTATFHTTYGERGQIPEAFFAWHNCPYIPNCKTDLLFLGSKISAAQAKTDGMVHKIVPVDKVNDEAYNIACQIAALPCESFLLMKKYMVNDHFAKTIKQLNAEFEDILNTWRCPKYLERLRNYMSRLES